MVSGTLYDYVPHVAKGQVTILADVRRKVESSAIPAEPYFEERPLPRIRRERHIAQVARVADKANRNVAAASYEVLQNIPQMRLLRRIVVDDCAYRTNSDFIRV